MPTDQRRDQRDQRPNIVLVLTDDHAAHALSAYDDTLLQTPNLDRLAQEGMRFDATYCTNALCAPSRASILTGTYSHVNGVRTLSTHFDAAQPTFVSMLRDAGYQTWLAGKWHLGHGGEHDPQGFDYWEVLDGQGPYWDPELISEDGRRTVSGYTTTILTDLAIERIRQRDPDRPFCLLLHHKAPHRSWDPDTAHAKLFADEDLPEPATLFDDHAGHGRAAREARMRIGRDLNERDLKAPFPPGLDEPERTRWAYQRYLKDYLRCVVSVDENTGRLLDVLDDEGLRDDTIVAYSSDQGFFLGDHGWYDKRFMYDESLRMPLLVRYPPEVPAGSATDAMALNIDFAQTFLDYAGIEAHPRMQGESLRPLLRGERPDGWRDSIYYRYWEHDDNPHHVEAHYGVRTERYKLIYYYARGFGIPGASDRTMPPEWELFDLERDPAELTNVWAHPAYADVREELRAELARLQAQYADEPCEDSA
ncbi:sulfatase/phosphatase domain-containing protein [Actinopolymorpha rutila]|uniref:Arylsulfatase A-like enzyme n=1 Tax=Actinopolymorpha rutila TaxID=446787 RepID=A0A852ZNH2_9ACTN|nr:arylsulfatase A-like enzyme [Actinopolymorpha rutila]